MSGERLERVGDSNHKISTTQIKYFSEKKKTEKSSRSSPIETFLKEKTHIYKTLFTKPEQMAEKS